MLEVGETVDTQGEIREVETSFTESITQDSKERSFDVLSGIRNEKGRNFNYSHLTDGEKLQLWEKVKDGDIDAKQLIADLNQGIVGDIVKEYIKFLDKFNLNVETEELFQEGNHGLMKAIKKFDPEKGNQFYTYAWWWINAYIEMAVFDKQNFIGMSSGTRRSLNKVKKIVRKFIQNNGRKPEPDEIAEEANMSVKRIKTYMEISNQSIISLDAGFDDEDDNSFKDFILDKYTSSEERTEEIVEKKEFEEMVVEKTFSYLNEKEKDIISKRCGFFGEEERTLQSIGNEYGITRERVSQVEKRALKKIRKELAEDI